jgi:serine/threonine-protein kinase
MGAQVTTGAVVAGFRIVSPIAEGAMGSVFVAEDTRRGGRVALKVLAPDLARDGRFRERFLRESRVAAALNHPHIVPIVDSGEERGILYLAMVLVDGLDLRDLLRRDGLLEPERSLSILSQVAEALDAAHRAGLVHRDVKPGNILLAADHDETAYVCDFGLARHLSSASSLTGDRGFVGTIDYVPPEQIEGGPIDGRADVYALGCVLFECLSGRRPFDRDSELSVVFAHLNEPPPRLSDLRPDLPEAFDEVFAVAMSKSPTDRYSTCGELVAAARHARSGRAFRRRRRSRRLVLAGVAAMVAAGAAIGGILATEGSPTGSHRTAITQYTIDGARLGFPAASYRQLFGEKGRRDTFDLPKIPLDIFDDRELSVYYDQSTHDGIVVTTWNKSFRTSKGIGPCSSLAAAKAAYGRGFRPAKYNTINGKVFAYTLGKDLVFAVNEKPPHPLCYIAAIALYNGGAPGATLPNGSQPFAGFVAISETSCR